MTPDTISTLVTAVTATGLVLAGLAALLALPWRREDLLGAERAARVLGHAALVAAAGPARAPRATPSAAPVGLAPAPARARAA